MFYLRYIAAELRRRKGRTVLTALGLAVGVGLVVTVTTSPTPTASPSAVSTVRPLRRRSSAAI